MDSNASRGAPGGAAKTVEGSLAAETLHDLLDAGCEAVCIGQYLRPTLKQREVEAFVTPEKFKEYEEYAYAIGFGFAVAGPFVRSSYRSEELMKVRLSGIELEQV